MATAAKPITIAIAEDHPLTLAGLRAVLTSHPSLSLVGEAMTGASAIELHARVKPDVLLVDLLLPDMTGADVVRKVRATAGDARVIVLTSASGSEDIHRALEAGARAYLLKTATPEELVRAIVSVHKGQRVIPDAVAKSLAEREPLSDLTARETEVLQQLVAGGSNKEIAGALGLGESTIHTHVSNIFMKLRVNDRAAAVAAALRRGIVR